MVNRNLVTIDDLSNGEMMGIFSLADEMSADIRGQFDLCRGKVMASLFFEPSTRTRLSFESAMQRLGASDITVSEIGASSLAKGESLADTARIVGSYADIVVIRHPWKGQPAWWQTMPVSPSSTRGRGHQHPTQTLCDLYTLIKERHSIKGLRVALWGDLKYGRTTHSLIFALARFGADIFFCPSPGLEVPDHIIEKLVREYGGEVERPETVARDEDGSVFPLDAVYTGANSTHQLAMIPDISVQVELREGVDALYVTRPQKERFDSSEEEKKSAYTIVDKKLLRGRAFRKSLIMHPLPRVDELAVDIDSDERSAYFKQAARGVPVRMALLSAFLGVKNIEIPSVESRSRLNIRLMCRRYSRNAPIHAVFPCNLPRPST
jgi:aspartate carbamoyltransferase catalytic subunit